MNSAIVRRNEWEINESFYFLSSYSDRHSSLFRKKKLPLRSSHIDLARSKN